MLHKTFQPPFPQSVSTNSILTASILDLIHPPGVRQLVYKQVGCGGESTIVNLEQADCTPVQKLYVGSFIIAEPGFYLFWFRVLVDGVVVRETTPQLVEAQDIPLPA